MYRIIKTELWKLKRYHIIWAGILLMLLSVGITLFASTALDGTVWTFPHLVERVIQNNTTTIFPMCITLIAGYIIAREKSDDTLKSIMTIPVSYPALIGGKLIGYGKYIFYCRCGITCWLSGIFGNSRNTGFDTDHP